jgi:hypothetical protein
MPVISVDVDEVIGVSGMLRLSYEGLDKVTLESLARPACSSQSRRPAARRGSSPTISWSS